MPKVRDYAIQLQRTFRVPYPRLTQRYVWVDDTIATAMARLEIGDLIRITNTALGTKGSYIDDWWYVEGIEHHLAVGVKPETVVSLVPSYIYRDLDKIKWDDFNRADSVGSLGATPDGVDWADDTGFDIESNYAKTNTITAQVPTVDLVATDMVVEVALSNLSVGGSLGGYGGLVYRHQDASNYWFLVWEGIESWLGVGPPAIVLLKRVAGVNTAVAAKLFPAISVDLRVLVRGNRHLVWADDRLIFDETDSALNTESNSRVGLYGLLSGVAGTPAIRFDNFYAQGLDEPLLL